MSALIEARSKERLQLLSEGLADPEFQTFYRRLAQSEAGHGTLFVRLARRAVPAGVNERLEALLQDVARDADDALGDGVRTHVAGTHCQCTSHGKFLREASCPSISRGYTSPARAS